ncbi:MAG: hypothetical protein ACRD42_02820 [Nitrososphaeraceae archaeon]
MAFAAFLPELGLLLLTVGGVLVAIGIGYIVVSYGLMKGRGWAWSVTLILSYIGIVMSIIAIVGGNLASIGHLIISIVIIYLLYRSQAKAFFGKSPNAMI